MVQALQKKKKFILFYVLLAFYLFLCAKYSKKKKIQISNFRIQNIEIQNSKIHKKKKKKRERKKKKTGIDQ